MNDAYCYFISDLSGVPLFGADKALEGHSIVCQQCCAPSMLCLLQTTAHHCLKPASHNHQKVARHGFLIKGRF